MSSTPKKSEKDLMMSTMVVRQGWRPEDYEYKNLKEFFPFYMSQHANTTCRRLHFVGTTLGLLLLASAILTVASAILGKAALGAALGKALAFLFAAHVVGYAFAWVGHFYFEHNRPATFKYPWLSYQGDYKMWWQILTGKIAW